MAKGKNVVAAPAMDSDWQAEDDLRTMKRAAEIHRDRKRMKILQKFAKKEVDGIKRVSKYAKLAEMADCDD